MMKKVKVIGTSLRLVLRISAFQIALLPLVFLLTSCAEPTPEVNDSNPENAESNLDQTDSRRAVLVESIIRSSPTIAETGKLFAVMGSGFNRAYLNDINNSQKYTTLRDQGLNLGIYLTDLGYVASFEQSQELIFYMNCSKKMAEGIGVSDVFDDQTVERMEMNINDKDSVLAMISDLYWKTDAFLKELNRENIAALIICGGWIEGMHIGGQIVTEEFEDDIVFSRMKDQQTNLKKILKLFDTFENDENIAYFGEKLKEIEADYSSMPKPPIVIKTNDVTIEEKEVLRKIIAKVEVLRSGIVSP